MKIFNNIYWYRNLLCTIWLSTVGFSSYASVLTEQSTQLLNNLHHKIELTLLSIARIEQEQGNDISMLSFKVKEEETVTADLGLILDISDVATGIKIEQVSKNSPAEAKSISPGSIISSINGIVLNAENQSQVIQVLKSITPEDEVQLTIDDGKGSRRYSIQAAQQRVPGYELLIGQNTTEAKQKTECGIISVQFMPPQTKDIFPAEIINVDGKGVDHEKGEFRLPVGKHVIKVHEYITDRPFTRRISSQKAKVMEINIEPNVKYYLGAKYDRKNRSKLYRDKYWHPIVWKTSNRDCQL